MGEKQDRYIAFNLESGQFLQFNEFFTEEAFELVLPFLKDPEALPQGLGWNFYVMPDLMKKDVVLWIPYFAGTPILKPEVLADPAYSGRPYVRVPMEMVRPEWHQDLKDYVKFRNGH